MRKSKEGTIYARGAVLWVAYYDERGERVPQSTGLRVGQEAEAQVVLDAVNRRVAAATATVGSAESGPLTVRRYMAHWISERVTRGVGSAKDDATRLRLHAEPFLGDLLVVAARPSHIRDFVRHLRAKSGPAKHQLSPRSVRHIYGLVRTMFSDAVVEERIPATPCVLKKGDLPKKVDKDSGWRSKAVFTRDEAETLMSDLSVPAERRVLYGVLFLTGMRIGEVSARRWRDLDTIVRPLGRLLVATSFNRKKQMEKSVKTERTREVPVHPTLSRILAGWRLSGWERFMGRQPSPEDLLLPSGTGRNLVDPVVLENLHRDLSGLGLRPRRTHDTRRTFISLARADGALKDVLKCITHGATGDQVDQYTTLPWESLCAEVSKLKLGLREGALLSLPIAVNSLAGGEQVLHQVLQRNAAKKKAPKNNALEAVESCPGRDSKTHILGALGMFEGVSGVITGPDVDYGADSPPSPALSRSTVATLLSEARDGWLLTEDRVALGEALQALLHELGRSE